MEVEASVGHPMVPKEAIERSKAQVSCSGHTSEEDQVGWTIPVGLAAPMSDSDVESVDVLRFDEPEGRTSFIAGEPPPIMQLAAAIYAAFGTTVFPAHATPAGN